MLYPLSYGGGAGVSVEPLPRQLGSHEGGLFFRRRNDGSCAADGRVSDVMASPGDAAVPALARSPARPRGQ
jgi:hypothetical protein